jgi:phosphatidylglycerophosphate synthase
MARPFNKSDPGAQRTTAQPRRWIRTNAANLVTASRLPLLCAMWAVAYRNQHALAVLLLISCATDILDGAIARRLKITSSFGAKFDSYTDMSVMFSAIVWIFTVTPELARRYAPVLVALTCAILATKVLSLAKFRRIVPLHLYSSKACTLCGYFFITYSMYGGSSPVAFWSTAAVYFATATEVALILIVKKHPDETVRSIFK